MRTYIERNIDMAETKAAIITEELANKLRDDGYVNPKIGDYYLDLGDSNVIIGKSFFEKRYVLKENFIDIKKQITSLLDELTIIKVEDFETCKLIKVLVENL